MSDAAAKPELRRSDPGQAEQGAVATLLHVSYDAAGVLAALCLAAIALINNEFDLSEFANAE